jgi:hypothetical protein
VHATVASLESPRLRATLWQMPFPQCVTNEDLQLAGERPFVPHRLQMSLPDWPVSIVLPKEVPLYSCEGLRVLVLCSDLSDNFIEIPTWVHSEFVVVMLSNYSAKPERRYGFAIDEYVSGDSASWEGRHDTDAVYQAIGFVVSLITTYHAEDYVVVVGASAGGLKVMEFLVAAEYFHKTSSVKLCVCIATAFHPTVMFDFCNILSESDVRCLVLHHVKDTLCPWWRPKKIWDDAASQFPVRVRVLELYTNDLQYYDANPHNVYKMLCAQTAFWRLVASQDSPNRFICRGSHGVGKGALPCAALRRFAGHPF